MPFTAAARRGLYALFFAALFISTPAVAQTRWIILGGGAWETGTNWSTGAPPAAGADVVIDAPGIYTVTLTSNPGVTFNSVTVSTPTGSPTQTLDIGAGGVLNTTAMTIAGPGVLSVSGGNLTTQTMSGAGGFNVTGGTATINGASILTGNTSISGGTVDTAGAMDLGALSLQGGLLTGAGPIRTTTFAWQGGGIDGTAGQTFTVNGPSTISTAALKTLNNRVFVNNLGCTWTEGNILAGNNAVFRNDTPNSNFNIDLISFGSFLQGGGATFSNNLGAVNKLGATIAAINVPFNNNGIVFVLGGLLGFDGGGTHGAVGPASFAVSPGATLKFAGSHTLTSNSNTNGTGIVEFAGGGGTSIAGGYNITGGTSVTGANPVTFPATAIAYGPINVSAGIANFNHLTPITVPSVALSAGSFSGTGTINVIGNVDWTGGGFDGSGILNANGGMTISGAATKGFTGPRRINNAGVADWTQGNINASNGAIFHNLLLATLQLRGNGNLLNAGGAPSSLINDGSIIKSLGTGNVSIQIPVTNNALVDVQTGNLFLSGGGTGAVTSTFTGAASTLLEFGGSGFVVNPGGQVNSLGTVRFNSTVASNFSGTYNVTGATHSIGGQTTINGNILSYGAVDVAAGQLNLNNAVPITIPSLNISGGLLAGGPLNVNGPFQWSGGTIDGTGTINLNVSSTISGPADKTLNNRNLNNNGSALWSGGNVLMVAGPATFDNVAGGTFQAQADATFFPSFVNHGTLEKNGGTGTTTFNPFFVTQGSVLATVGTMRFPGGFNQIGGSTTLQGGSLNSPAGFDLNAGSLMGTGAITGNVNNIAATVLPGTSPGGIDITGTYTQQTGGAINIELGGTTPVTQHDRLTATGNTILDGTLNVSLQPAYTPNNGDNFTVLTFGTRSGDFATKNGLTPGGGVTLSTVPGPTTYVISAAVIAPLSADVQVAKVDLVDPVTMGNNIQYTVTVTNAGPDPATNVVMTDNIPAGTTLVSFTPSQGGCIISTGLVCSLGNLAPSTSATIAIEVAPIAPASYQNTVNVGAAETDPNPTNNADTENTLVTQAADVSVTKSASPNPIDVGQNLTYTIMVNNSGPGTATNVVMTDILPASVTFVSVTTTTGTCTGTTTITCNLGSLGVTVGPTITITVRPNVAGPLSNTAMVTATEADPNGTNNSATATVTVNALPADLVLSKTASAPTIDIGQTLTYTITIQNLGTGPATNVVMTDAIPASVTFVSATPSQGTCTGTTPMTCNLGTIPVGAPASVSIDVIPSTTGPLSNTAIVAATETDPDMTNNTDTVGVTVTTPTADLSITKSASPDPVNTGQNLTYTIVVSNAGPSAAGGVVVTDVIPAGPTLVSATSSQGNCNTTVVCNLGLIANGAGATITIVVTPTVGGTLSNSASVTSSAVDPDKTNDSAVATVTVVAVGSNLALNKTASPARITSGQEVTYRLEVKNLGPGDATSVRITDTLPAQSQIVSMDAGCIGSGFTVTCRPGDLKAGNTAVMSLVVRLNGSGRVVNTAKAELNELDPDRFNNTSFASTQVDSAADLAIFKSGPAEVVSGARVRYELRVSNNSTIDAIGVGVRDILESVLTNATWTCTAPAGAGCSAASGTGNLDTTVDLSAGTTAMFEIEALLESGTTGRLPNAAELRVPQGFLDANADNNRATTEAVINPAVCPSDYKLFIGVVPEVEGGQDFEVIVMEAPPTATDFEYQFADNLGFNNAETRITPNTRARFTAPQVQQRKKFFLRARALNCNSADFSRVAELVVFEIQTTNLADPNLKGQLGTTQSVFFNLFLPGSVAASKNGLNGTVSLSTDKSYLTVNPPTVTVPAQGTTVRVTANTTALPLGTTTGTVVVTSTTTSQTTATVPVSVTLTTPMVPIGKTPAPPNALIVPVVAFAEGINSRWISDLRISNTAAIPIRYQLSLTPSEQIGTLEGKQTVITLDPGQTVAFDNIAEHQFGIGSLGESGSGVLEIRPIDFANKGDEITGQALLLATVASSKTYNKALLGTVGQFIPAIPFSRAIGPPTGSEKQVMSMQHVAQSSSTRTNVGFVEGAGNSATVLLRVFNMAGQKLDEFTVDLDPLEHRQLNSILASRNITLPEGRIEVEVTSQTGRILSYASMIDTQTSDPLFVPGIEVSQAGASKFIVPGVADLTRASGELRTDLRMFNASTQPVTARMDFYRMNESTPAKTANVTVGAGEVRAIDSLLATLFNETNIGGTLHITTDAPAPLIVSARMSNRVAAGATSQFIEARTENDAATSADRALQILQLEESERFRSNVGIVEVGGQAVTVEVSGVVPDSKVETKFTVELQPNEFKQYGSIFKLLGQGRVYNGRVSIKVLSGSGKILAYGSVIDNQSTDATFIPAQ